jgi:hypothetical protein
MQHIEAHPEEWDQAQWICGTRACLAGRIVLQAGATPDPDVPKGWSSDLAILDGYGVSIPDAARRIAGLTWAEGQHLFHASVTLEEMCHDTTRITNDLAMDCNPYGSMRLHHHWWTDATGATIVSAHRRTVFVYDAPRHTIIDFPTRALAYDYASDIATARLLDYDRNTEPPEVPA